MRFLCLLAAFFVMLAPNAMCDGLIRDLPSTGQWSTYRMSEQWSDGTERELKITIKRLGSDCETPKDLTWIEVVFETLDGKTRSSYRFLTPTESIANGDPMAAAVDIWVRKHDGEASRDMEWGEFLPRLSLVCMPKLTAEKSVGETRVVVVKGKELICPMISGKYTKDYASETANADCVIAKSDSVPFGVAYATYTMRCIAKCDPDPTAECNLTTGSVEFLISDFGDNAVPFVDVKAAKVK